MLLDFKNFTKNSYVIDNLLLFTEYEGLCAKYKNIIKLNLPKWHPKRRWLITKLMGRAIYSIISDAKKISTGLISRNANILKNKPNKNGLRIAYDHCLKPQLWGEFFFDFGDYYYNETKESFSEWERIMNYLCHTIEITNKENDLLSLQTHRDNDTKELDRYTLLEDSYNTADISLETPSNGFYENKKLPLSIPDKFKNWEKKLYYNIKGGKIS
jgi:hypothetical protein